MNYSSLVEKLKRPDRLKRGSRYIRDKAQAHYEFIVAPFIAKYFWFVLWPIYFCCKKYNINFVVNIASTMGHVIAELDNFFRASYLDETSSLKRYIWVKKTDPYAQTCTKLYRKKFWKAVSSTWIYNLSLPLTMAFKDITYDAGISRLKWQLPKVRKYKEFKGDTHLHQVSKKEGLDLTIRYFNKIEKSPDFFPLADIGPPSEEIINFLPNGTANLALIQIKDVVRNATAKKPDPIDYLQTLKYLKTLGYQLVFVGREKMPPIFQDYGVINYAESRIASLYNDIHLFHIAEIILLTGCGISVLADALNKHYLYLNSWHLSVPPFSSKSIYVPTRVQHKSGRFLTFSEQNQLYQSLADIGAEVFPKETHSAHNATSEEILMATQELLELKKRGTDQVPLTHLQKQLRTLDPLAPMYYTQSRCSQFFLEKYRDLL